MRVKIRKQKTIEDYMVENAQSRTGLGRFISLSKMANWSTIDDIKKTFPRASVICEGKRVVFRIGGGSYRMICRINFRGKAVFLYIKFIGTHAEYDKVRKENNLCGVSNY